MPVLVDGDVRLSQSLAIIDYLDGKWPEPSLFPSDPADRALVWSMALHVACEIQPLNNLRVERYLATELGLDAEAANALAAALDRGGLRRDREADCT